MRPVSELAVDLGTSTTQVFARGEGVVLDDLSVAAVERRSGKVIAVGRNACDEVGNGADRLDLVHPLHNGTVVDASLAQGYLNLLLAPFSGRRIGKLNLLITVPSSASRIERRVVREVARGAGASSIELIESNMSAALGADLPLHEPAATAIVDIGAGCTDASLISLGAVVGQSSNRSGSAAVDIEIKNQLRREYGLLVSDLAAERIKVAAGAAPGDGSEMVEARGVTAIDGSTVTAILEASELVRPLGTHLDNVYEVVRACLTQAPPELAQDVILRGVHLVGGGAVSPGLRERIAAEFDLPVHIVDEPRLATVNGAGKCLEAMDSLRDLFLAER